MEKSSTLSDALKVSKNANEASTPQPRAIQLLPRELIHRIAAGEIVDRPASVLKELIENSIDAGSTHVKITLVDGGLQLIQVEDNGWGLSHDDLEACVQRHATSKIRALEELDSIATLGFRGEALAAVASVSRLNIETHREGNGSWKLEVVGGAKQPISPTPRAKGTKISVADLFFNIPARRKFLKRASTEAQECADLLESLALTHPEVAFEWYLIHAKGEIRSQAQLPRESAVDRFVRVLPMGGDVFHVEREGPVEGVSHIEILGYKPPIANTFQKNVRLSVNGRFITDKRLPYALREAFAGLIEVGAYPCVFVNLKVDPSTIDVNIHPQKKEIRWPTGFSLGGLVYSLIRPVFEISQNFRKETNDKIPNFDLPLLPEAAPASSVTTSNFRFEPGSSTNLASVPHSRASASHADGAPCWKPQISPGPYSQVPAAIGITDSHLSSQANPRFGVNPNLPLVAPREGSSQNVVSKSSVPPFDFKNLRVIGESGAAWIVCESPDGVVIIDQHAAHERVMFERILKSKNLLRSKPLLLPLKIPLAIGVNGHDPKLRALLESLGFELSDPELHSDSELEFIAMPEADRSVNWSKILEKIFFEAAHDEVSSSPLATITAKLAASLACHGSVRRGQRLSEPQIRDLLRDLSDVEWGGLCPHGRPLWLLIRNTEIEEQFHRS